MRTRALHSQARLWRLLASCTGLLALSGYSHAANAPLSIQSGPLVQFINTDEREDHADISIQFSCTVFYVSNTPVSHGSKTTITLRLGPDCGNPNSTIPPELPLVGGGGHLVTGARLDSIVPGQVTLELTWARDLDFVMAPTAGGLGLRVRLIGTGTNRRKGSGLVAEVQAPEGYAVNLDSSLTKFDRATVEAAAASFKTQAYVSETDIEDKHWYRLRVGPFTTRAEAERVLQIAQKRAIRARGSRSTMSRPISRRSNAPACNPRPRAGRPTRRCRMPSVPSCCAMRASRSRSINTRRPSTC